MGLAEVSVGVMFLAGTVAVAVISGVFVSGGKYRRPPKSLSPVEFGWAREEAEAMLAGLAPRLMALAEKEKVAGDGAGISFEVAERRVWERFAAASADLDDDPLAAIEEMRSLAGVLDGLSESEERSGDDGAS